MPGPAPLTEKRRRRLWAERPAGRDLALVVVAGLGLALGLQPFALWPLALAALALGMRRIALAGSWRAAAWTGFAFGLGHFGLGMIWIFEPFVVDLWRYGWMAPFAVLLMAGGLALFWALAGGLAALAPRPLMALSVSLGAVELARGYVFTGFPWAAPGQVLVGTPFMQLAALVGPNGLNAALLAVAALAARGRWPELALGLGLLVAGWGFGQGRLAAPAPPEPGAVLRLVQPNAAQGLKWDPDMAQIFLDRLLAASRAAPSPALGPPDLVIWPESALPYLIEGAPGLQALVASAGRGAMMAVGRQRVEGPLAWNSLTVFDPAGPVIANYDKHHLVPFGEYIPLGELVYDLFGIGAFAARTGKAYAAGPGPAVLDLGAKLGRVLPLICYEAVFPRNVRGAPERPDWLLQVTNDAWFGTFSGPFQHEAQARLRAVESGLPLVRVANTGVTEVVDARGQVLARLPFGQEAHLDATLPGALPPTPYWVWGEGPLLVWLAGLGGLAFRPRRRPLA